MFLITWIIAVGFPTLATYKALKSNDLTLMRPWLMYWAVLKLVESAETLLSPILDFILFYSWFRMGFALWLVSSGAVEVWNNRIEPFLTCYEPDLDSLVANLYQRVYARLFGPAEAGAAGAAGAAGGGAPPRRPKRRPTRGTRKAVLEALSSAWSRPTSTEQASKQRSYLQAMLDSLDREQEEFVAVESVPEPEPRRGWLW